jgi:hypothetical protein
MQVATIHWELPNDSVSINYSEDLQNLSPRFRMALLNDMILKLSEEIRYINEDTPFGQADDSTWVFSGDSIHG